MTEAAPLKPLIWVRSSRADFGAFPEAVKDRMGYALYVAQQGGKHADAKPLKGFGGAGVIEIIRNHKGDTFRAVYTVRLAGRGLCVACFQKEIEDRA
jgi:phage-related protein